MKELHIDMPMLQKKLVGKIYESWEEMTWQLITHVLRVFNAPMPQWSAEEAMHWQNMQILKAINGWTDADLKAWRTATVLSNQDVDMLTAQQIWLKDLDTILHQSVQFAFQPITENTENKRVLSQTLYKNPLPVIKVKAKSGTFQKWFAAYSDAENPFRDCTLYELGRIFTLYEQFRESGEETHFCELLAILYRPEKPRKDRQNDDSDDMRQPLESSVKKMRVRIAIVRDQIHPSVKKTIELHLTSAMSRFAELYASVFSKKKTAADKKGDFLDFVLELADYDPQKSDDLFKRSAHDMFELAERLIKRVKSEK